MAIIVQYLGCKIYFIFENVKMKSHVLLYSLAVWGTSSIFVVCTPGFLKRKLRVLCIKFTFSMEVGTQIIVEFCAEM